MKGHLRRVLVSHNAVRALRPVLLRRAATVFTFHRFAHPEGDPEGADLKVLREFLVFLRREKYALVSLDELVTALLGGKAIPRHAVVFTIDDGYFDFVEAAAPLFREFDCPSTVFLVTGFLDRRLWLWWDQVEYVLLRAPISPLIARLGGQQLRIEFDSLPSRRRRIQDLVENLKRVDDDSRRSFIADLSSSSGVEIPARCPDRYRPMTWDNVRSLASKGVQFGPHTVTHPILRQVADDVAVHEMGESWRRVRAETDAAIPIFCYPNGDPLSCGQREVAIARDLGLKAAVTTEQRHVDCSQVKVCGWEAAFKLPRFAYFDSMDGLVQTVSGIENCKRAIRSFLGKT